MSSDSASTDAEKVTELPVEIPEKVTCKLKVQRAAWFFFMAMSLKDVRIIRPCGGSWKKEHQQELFRKIQFVTKPFKPIVDDGVFVTIEEEYKLGKDQFPGRLYSPGTQSLWGPVRANFHQETADLDMKNAQPTCLLWWCTKFGIKVPLLREYVQYRDTGPNGEAGKIDELAKECNVTRKKAKELFIAAWNDGKRFLYIEQVPESD